MAKASRLTECERLINVAVSKKTTSESILKRAKLHPETVQYHKAEVKFYEDIIKVLTKVNRTGGMTK